MGVVWWKGRRGEGKGIGMSRSAVQCGVVE